METHEICTILLYFLFFKVTIPKISGLVVLLTHVGVDGNRKYGLILQAPEFKEQHKLFEQLLCQKCNRRETGVTVYTAAKQTHAVLIKKSVLTLFPMQ